jgi:SAM-dependent methyltransferase
MTFNPAAMFSQQSAEFLALKSDAFSAILCFDVLEHLPHPLEGLREIHRVARRNALVFVSTPNLESMGRTLKQDEWHGYRDPTHVSIQPVREWEQAFDEVGFELLDRKFDGLVDTPYVLDKAAILEHMTVRLLFTVNWYFGFPVPRRLGENVFFVLRVIKQA